MIDASSKEDWRLGLRRRVDEACGGGRGALVWLGYLIVLEVVLQLAQVAQGKESFFWDDERER